MNKVIKKVLRDSALSVICYTVVVASLLYTVALIAGAGARPATFGGFMLYSLFALLITINAVSLWRSVRMLYFTIRLIHAGLKMKQMMEKEFGKSAPLPKGVTFISGRDMNDVTEEYVDEDGVTKVRWKNHE